METLNIAGRRVGRGEAPFIIAEIGSNHNGDLALCKRLIQAAKQAGVDAVKFQSWSKASLISQAEYARRASYAPVNGASTLEQEVERYQLTPDQHIQVTEFCAEIGICFFSSCFSHREVDMLDSLNVPAYKIASMDINHLPLLDYVARKGRPVILSTGLATLGEIERALGILRPRVPVALLHCLSIYPTPPEMVHLENIRTLERAFDVPVGYSDHCLGNAVALASVALGACIVEKHFTLDTKLDGWDHAISADPEDMRKLVAEAAAVHAALGSPVRTISGGQVEKRKVFRRRAVLRRALCEGALVTADDVDFKRPGTGIGPDELQYIVGRRLRCNVDADHELEWSELA